ncbi:MAG: branched-chain amino acid ABC transporter permease [Porticoccaceae bacterium]
MNPDTIYWLQQLLNALQLGSIYALIALGYSMVYGILTMINFAHGDVFMIGAFCCLLAATALGLPFAPTLLLTMAGTALLGVVIERLAYKPLRNAPRVSAIITALGVGLFLQNATLALSPYPKAMPPLLDNLTWQFAGISVSSLQLIVICLSLGLMLVLDHVVHRTPVGMAMRAIAWDKTLVPLMGIPVNLIISITFAIGAGLAGAAGTMYSLAYPVIDPQMGIMVGWKAFIAAVVGGIGNIRGAMIGAFILGGVEIMVVALLPSTYRDFIVFSLLLLLVIIRPQGILGQAREQKV